MTDLSPAAQAVSAVSHSLRTQDKVAAAVLRVAVGYLFPKDIAQQCYDRLLSIADELVAQ